MSIEVACENCGHKFRRPEALIGKRAKCPQCKRLMIIPESSADTSSTAGAADVRAEQNHEKMDHGRLLENNKGKDEITRGGPHSGQTGYDVMALRLQQQQEQASKTVPGKITEPLAAANGSPQLRDHTTEATRETKPDAATPKPRRDLSDYVHTTADVPQDQLEGKNYSEIRYFVDILSEPIGEINEDEALYPWASVCSPSTPLIETTIGKTAEGAIELENSFQSKWQDVFGILTGGILSAIFSACFQRHKVERFDRDSIVRCVRLKKSHVSALSLSFAPVSSQILYQLHVKSPKDKTYIHMFRLAVDREWQTHQKYLDAQAYVDGLIRSVVPADRIVEL